MHPFSRANDFAGVDGIARGRTRLPASCSIALGLMGARSIGFQPARDTTPDEVDALRQFPVVIVLLAGAAAMGMVGCSSGSRQPATDSVPVTSVSAGASAAGQDGSQAPVESSAAIAPSSGSTSLVTCQAGELRASIQQAPSPPQQENEWLISIGKNSPGQCALDGWPALIGTTPGGTSVVIPTSRDTTDAWPAAEPVSEGHPSTIAVIDRKSCDPSGAVPPAGVAVLFSAIRIKLVSGTVAAPGNDLTGCPGSISVSSYFSQPG
jgi:hypothetical protein